MKNETDRLISFIDNFKFQMKNEDKIEDVKNISALITENIKKEKLEFDNFLSPKSLEKYH